MSDLPRTGPTLAPELQEKLDYEYPARSGSAVGDGLRFIKEEESVDVGRGF